MSALEKTVQITNKRGLHARAAAKFVRLAESFGCQITVTKDDMHVGGDSIMGLLMLSGSQGTSITLKTVGEGAEDALRELSDLVEQRFGEEA